MLNDEKIYNGIFSKSADIEKFKDNITVRVRVHKKDTRYNNPSSQYVFLIELPIEEKITFTAPPQRYSHPYFKIVHYTNANGNEYIIHPTTVTAYIDKTSNEIGWYNDFILRDNIQRDIAKLKTASKNLTKDMENIKQSVDTLYIFLDDDNDKTDIQTATENLQSLCTEIITNSDSLPSSKVPSSSQPCKNIYENINTVIDNLNNTIKPIITKKISNKTIDGGSINKKDSKIYKTHLTKLTSNIITSNIKDVQNLSSNIIEQINTRSNYYAQNSHFGVPKSCNSNIEDIIFGRPMYRQ